MPSSSNSSRSTGYAWRSTRWRAAASHRPRWGHERRPSYWGEDFQRRRLLAFVRIHHNRLVAVERKAKCEDLGSQIGRDRPYLVLVVANPSKTAAATPAAPVLHRLAADTRSFAQRHASCGRPNPIGCGVLLHCRIGPHHRSGADVINFGSLNETAARIRANPSPGGDYLTGSIRGACAAALGRVPQPSDQRGSTPRCWLGRATKSGAWPSWRRVAPPADRKS